MAGLPASFRKSCVADTLQGDFTAFDQDPGEVINCYRRGSGMC